MFNHCLLEGAKTKSIVATMLYTTLTYLIGGIMHWIKGVGINIESSDSIASVIWVEGGSEENVYFSNGGVYINTLYIICGKVLIVVCGRISFLVNQN